MPKDTMLMDLPVRYSANRTTRSYVRLQDGEFHVLVERRILPIPDGDPVNHWLEDLQEATEDAVFPSSITQIKSEDPDEMDQLVFSGWVHPNDEQLKFIQENFNPTS